MKKHNERTSMQFKISGDEVLSAHKELQFTKDVSGISTEELRELYSKATSHNAELQGQVAELSRANSEMKDALKESEERARLKLESILASEWEIGNLNLGDIIDARTLQSLMDDFHELTRMPMSLIDVNGKVLAGVGWQKICTEFHRVNSDTCRNCIESDVQLSAGVPVGEYKIYKCKNNMWDVATPVMLGDKQLGNLFMGQFFFEDEQLDYELFRAQARTYRFDESEYIAALEAVPRLSRENLNTSMSFFMKLADVLSKLSYSNLKLVRSLSERDALMLSLHQNEQRLRLFIEHAPAALAMFDTDMRYRSVSRRWLSDYGLGERTLIGESHYDVFPEITAEWREAHRRGLAGEVLRAEGDRFERADGSVQWVRWEIRPWYDAQGKVGGIVIFAEDMTDIKEAEEILRRYQLLAEHSRDIVLFVRRDDGRILDANAAAVNTYGYDHKELLGLTVRELRAPETMGLTAAQMAEADTKGILFESVHRRRDGSIFPVEVSSQGATIGGIRTLISIVRDITKRKRAEEASAQLAAIVESSDDAIIAKDRNGVILNWNAGAERLFGYRAAEIAGRPITLLIPPEQQEEELLLLHRILAGERIDHFETVRLSKDGRRIDVSVTVSPIKNSEGRIIGASKIVRDITERKRAEEALRESMSREQERATELATLLDAVPTPVFVAHDTECLHITGNRAADELLYIPRGAEASLSAPAEFRPRHFRALKDGRELRLDELPAQRAARGILVEDFEFNIAFDDGTTRHVLGYGTPLRDEEGRPRGAVHVLVDITERKRMEESLRESEERYRNLVESAQFAIFINRNNRIEYANPSALKLFGVNSIDELIGRSPYDFVHPEFHAAMTKRIEMLLDGDRVPVAETRILQQNGVERFVEVNAVTFTDIQGPAIQVMMHDITERKQAEDELRASEEKFSAMLLAVPIAIALATLPDGALYNVNPAWLDLTGVARKEEAIGKTSLELGLIADAAQRQSILNEFRQRGFVRNVEQTFCTTKGVQRTVLVNLDKVEIGGRTFILSTMEEITERKRAEEELFENHRKLEAMAIELSLAEERERDRIAGELHDQVGQRLIFGKMKLGALASQVQVAECMEHVEALERIIDLSIQDIRTLTFQLRPPLLASVGLEAALRWLGEEFQENNGLLLTFCDVGQQKPMRYEARSTVFQAVREILLNTVKHADATRIGITVRRDADMLLVCVSDNGRGFDLAEAREKKTKSGGFGLINVQRRIEHLGGSIMIESRPGSGTRVTIMAPLDISLGQKEGNDEPEDSGCGRPHHSA